MTIGRFSFLAASSLLLDDAHELLFGVDAGFRVDALDVGPRGVLGNDQRLGNELGRTAAAPEFTSILRCAASAKPRCHRVDARAQRVVDGGNGIRARRAFPALPRRGGRRVLRVRTAQRNHQHDGQRVDGREREQRQQRQPVGS